VKNSGQQEFGLLNDTNIRGNHLKPIRAHPTNDLSKPISTKEKPSPIQFDPYFNKIQSRIDAGIVEDDTQEGEYGDGEIEEDNQPRNPFISYDADEGNDDEEEDAEEEGFNEHFQDRVSDFLGNEESLFILLDQNRIGKGRRRLRENDTIELEGICESNRRRIGDSENLDDEYENWDNIEYATD
jgi:hypothetical protein